MDARGSRHMSMVERSRKNKSITIILVAIIALALSVPLIARGVTGQDVPTEVAEKMEKALPYPSPTGIFPQDSPTDSADAGTGIGAVDDGPVISNVVTEPTAEPSLTVRQRINQQGFMGPRNIYTWSLCQFKNSVYAGTADFPPYLLPPENHLVMGTKLSEAVIGALSGADNPPGEDLGGTEVYRYSGYEDSWQKVVDDGLNSPFNAGLRDLVVWDDGKGEAMYGGTFNLLEGCEVWRTYDGINWENVVGGNLTPDPENGVWGNGFCDGDYDIFDGNESVRGMTVFKGKLYVGTLTRNLGEIWCTSDGEDWGTEPVVTGTELGIESIIGGFSDLAVFDDGTGEALYAAASGDLLETGFKIFKSYDGENFDEVATRGVNGGGFLTANIGVFDMVEFNGRLWILTLNFSGFQVLASKGKIYSNDDWETILVNGFTDKNNLYAWRGAVFGEGEEERLYIGTMNLKLFLFPSTKGFYLYSVTKQGDWAIEVGELPDGVDVEAGAPNGIRSNHSYGARTLLPVELGDTKYLMLGCAGLLKKTDVYLLR